MNQIDRSNGSCAITDALLYNRIFFLYRQDLSDRPSYSVAAWDEPHHDVILAEDITDRLEIAEHFLLMLLQEEVSPCHLADILEDSFPLR